MTELVALIWGADPPTSAVGVIHKYVGVLRRLIEPHLRRRTSGSFLLRDGNGYRVTAGAETLDLMRFRRHVAAARASADEARPEEALVQYSDALRLCRGAAGESLSDSSGAAAIFAGINSEFFDAAVAAADIAVRLHRPSGVLPPLRLAVEMDPFNELVHASLVITLAAAGQQAEALAVYRAIRQRLADDLGIDPGQSLQQAHQQVLTQNVSPPARDPQSVPVISRIDDSMQPAPLVRPAQLPPDLSLFVGRSAELAFLGGLVAGMRDDARTGPLVVAVDGMGGVGESTLAARFARSVAGDFTDGQLYLDLHGEQGDALLSPLYALGVPASLVPDTFDARVGTYRSLTVGKRILVLLDNVADPAQVRPLLPNSAESLVLITSRRPLLGLAALDGAHLMHLEVPDAQPAREFAAAPPVQRAEPNRRRTGCADRRRDPRGVRPVAAGPGDLGRAPDRSSEPVARLRRRRVARGAPAGGFPRLGGRSRPAAFAWSYRQLSDGAARLFRLLAVTLGPGVTAAASIGLSASTRTVPGPDSRS